MHLSSKKQMQRYNTKNLMKYNAFNWAYYMKGSAIGGAFYVVDGYRIYLINLT